MTIYTVITQCANEITTSSYLSRREAEQAVCEASGQEKDEWDFDDGTVFDGDSNYETSIWIERSEIKK